MNIIWSIALLVLGILMISVLAVNAVVYWIGWVVLIAAAVSVITYLVRR